MKSFKLFFLFVIFATYFAFAAKAEDTTSDSLEVNYVKKTFFSTRIINSHSVVQPKKGEMEFRISHRFGEIKSGAYDLWGLDQATTHFSLEYNPFSKLTVGLGRSNYLKTYDGFVKFTLFKQQTGVRNVPLSVSYLGSTEYHSINTEIPDFNTVHRFNFTHQLLVARKFGDVLSVQLTPTLVHKNLVDDPGMKNNIFALGFGGSVKVSKRVSINWDTYWVDHGKMPEDITYFMPIAVGVDIKTGDHVFQIMLSNSLPMRESGFITETTGDVSKGEIHLGFNISRLFYLHY